MLIGATTENPFFEVNAPLLSRSTLWRLEPLSPSTSWRRWWPGAWPPRGPRPSRRRWRPWSAWPTATPGPCSPPWRWPWPWPATAPVTLDDVERARHSRLHHYGEDDHYDQVSAFIKSIRGSDPDAGLYWLARMLEAGRGRPVHRPAAGHPGQRGHRGGRPPGPGGGRRRRPGRRVRGAARGPAQPGPGRGPPGLRPQVQPGHRGPGPGPAATCGRVPGATSRPTCATPTTGVRRRSATARGTSTPTTGPGPGPTSSTGPTSCQGHRYYEPSDRGHEAVVAERLARWRSGGGPVEPVEPEPVDDRPADGLGQTGAHDAAGTEPWRWRPRCRAWWP